MKLTIYGPELKDLPDVKLTLPRKFENKNVQILYGYTQPRKPYDRTLFIQLILPIHTTKRTLKSMTNELKRILKKSWDKSNYEIVKVDDEYKSYQSFLYFQLKRVHRALVRPGLLSTPLKVPKLKETSTTKRKTSRKKSTKKKVRKSSARKKTTTKKKTTRKKTKTRKPKRPSPRRKTTRRTKKKGTKKKRSSRTNSRKNKKTKSRSSKRRR